MFTMTKAIEVRGVGKQYFRGVQHGHNRISQALAQWGLGLLGMRRNDDRAKHDVEPFWALKDISFSIEQGEVVGIIGRNGSGKSTLLKIIAQITAPTTGDVSLSGRTGTLLEVGTGFHPELTGRENVYLNGAILGMSQAEIARKFDEIVDFSGVEAFIDTPVKRYSSGMQTRLAFSVAAHLEPEILIVDEVLAVGDAEFQKKCLGKMNEVSKTGRTVLFVSHKMSAIDQLCGRVIWLDRGVLMLDSTDTYAATSRYLFGDEEQPLKGGITVDDVPPLDTEFFTFQSFRIKDAQGTTISGPVLANAELSVEIRLRIKKLHPSLTFGYAVYNEAGEVIYWSVMTDARDGIVDDLRIGEVALSSPVPPRFLNQGLYRLDLMTSLHFINWFTAPGDSPYAVFLRIEGGMSDSVFWVAKRPGVVAPALPWKVALLAQHATT
jgi:lipopolysaccharide transport system ATP-binding protein